MVKLNLSLAPYIHVDSIQQSLSPPYYLTSELPSLALSSSSRGKQGGGPRNQFQIHGWYARVTSGNNISANSTTHFGDFESRNQPRMHAVASRKRVHALPLLGIIVSAGLRSFTFVGRTVELGNLVIAPGPL